MKLKPQTTAFWQQYVNSLPDAEAATRRLSEVFQIGDTEQSADEGAALIKQGRKTTTSSLLWEYEVANRPLPQVGSLSIVEDGRGTPVCIVETTWVAIKEFAEVDAQFAYDYGEWDCTLESWRAHCWGYYEAQCRSLGKLATVEMPLVCERFRVVYP
jgi:uncharacterized protein YhfF